MDRHPRACWFAAIRGAQKAKDVEDCLKSTAAPPLNSRVSMSPFQASSQTPVLVTGKRFPPSTQASIYPSRTAGAANLAAVQAANLCESATGPAGAVGAIPCCPSLGQEARCFFCRSWPLPQRTRAAATLSAAAAHGATRGGGRAAPRAARTAWTRTTVSASRRCRAACRAGR